MFSILHPSSVLLSLMASVLLWPMSALAQVGPPPNLPPSTDFFELKQEATDPGLISAPSPVMPAQAVQSGYCCVDFDIGADGKARNTVASYCSEPLFEANALSSVNDAEFSPATIGGVRRLSRGHSFDVTFKKKDVNGVLKPSADGRLTQTAIDSGTALCPV